MADSEMYQYRRMAKALKKATKDYSIKNNVPEKKIVFSICEWGFGKPYNWGRKAGNLWRTTLDIFPNWFWIKCIYNHNVKLYKYSKKSHYNDPDMLEVGNGKLTYPVGLITLDEVVLAGYNTYYSNSSDYENPTNYLHTGEWYWTFSPVYIDMFGGHAYAGTVRSTGDVNNDLVATTHGVRPVVSLSDGTLAVPGGEGTTSNPYVVE